MNPPKLEEFLENLNLIEDRQDRIEALISVSETFRPVPPEISRRPHAESHRVPGCESEAFTWVHKQPDATGQLFFDVLNPQGISAMALAAILTNNVSGESLTSIAALDEEIVFRIFGRDLSMGKSLGLLNMIRAIKAQAA